LGIALTPAVAKRLAVFNEGTQSCTIHAAEERFEEAYQRSIHKLLAE
jgi:hypothetical protein